MLTGMYVPGDSMLHRASPGPKLLGLLVFSSVLLILASPAGVVGCALVTVAGYGLARLGPAALWCQVRPLRWVVLLLVPFQLWTSGPELAFVSIGTLVVAVAAAGLVTLTTRIADLLDAVTRWLTPVERVSWLGVDAERIALLFALTIRAIPVISDTYRRAGEARRARGLERSPRALLTPFLNGTIRHAQRVGEALIARGVDD